MPRRSQAVAGPRRPPLAPLPDFIRYDCQACGQCCGGNLAVEVTPAEADMIVRQGWADRPELGGRPLFLPRGDKLYLAHRDDGACVFLNEQQHCRIHAEFGSEGKPLGCRLYPYLLLPAGREIRLDLRFDCLSVAANHGRPLPAHTADAQSYILKVIPALDLDPVPFRLEGTDDDAPEQAWLDRITAAFERLLLTPDLSLTRKLTAAVNLAAALDSESVAQLEAQRLEDLLVTAVPAALRVAEQDPLLRRRLARGLLTTFRQWLGVYGRVDRLAELPTPYERLRQALALAWGRGRVPKLRADWPDVRFPDLEGEWGEPSPEAGETLLRFYRLKLRAQAFCGLGFFGYPYLPGLRALWLTYPVILWFARMFAAGEGRRTLTDRDVQLGLRVTDHRHGRSAQMALPGERARVAMLTDREVLRALILAYGT